MSDCARCGIFACYRGEMGKAPANCPMKLEADVYEEELREYQKPEVSNLACSSALTESGGYLVWTRMEEIIHFSRKAGFNKLGLAFCVGLRREAAVVDKILSGAGFSVDSVVCKTGSVPKEALGLSDDQKVRPGQFEAMCNPVTQAKILNRGQTELNILLGLCVGHDTLFIKYSLAPVTILAVKDRVLAHNPLGAIYATHYFGRRFEKKD